MKRAPLIFTLVIFLCYKLLVYLTDEPILSLSVFALPIGLLLVNFALRKKIRYKSWFTSSIQFMIEKEYRSEESDIPISLLYEKLLEVVNDSEFKLLDKDDKNHRILIGTSVNFWTWGENIYIDLIENEDDTTKVEMTFVTLFGNTSWNRNSQHYSSFMSSFEASLTI